jgi:hypothetical protein
MAPNERQAGAGERLDAALQALPPGIEPGRDLWPGIAARLEQAPVTASRRLPAWLLQAAAAVVLVAGSSLFTARLLDGDRAAGKMAEVAPVAGSMPGAQGIATMPAAFGPAGRMDPEYAAARRQLTSVLESRMARLPASTRAKLESNLAELRRAADEINAALAEQPGDPLLEELLLKTYQDELAVLANVNQLTSSLANAAASPGDAKRMEL